MSWQQKPIPDNVMTAYRTVLFRSVAGDGWRLCVYLTDSFGRKWTVDVDTSEPRMLAGQTIAPNEWLNVPDEDKA